MKEKIKFILEIALTCIVGFFAFFGLLCFVKMIAEKSADSNKTEEISHNIHYSKYNLNENVGSLLIISGNGFVLKEVVDAFEDIEAIYVCGSISGMELNAFRDVAGLKTVVISYAIYQENVPRQTDVFYIEDNEYMEFIEPYLDENLANFIK